MSIERSGGMATRRYRTATLVSLLVIVLVGAPLSFWLSVGAADVAVVAVLVLAAVSFVEVAASWFLWGGPLGDVATRRRP